MRWDNNKQFYLNKHLNVLILTVINMASRNGMAEMGKKKLAHIKN
jgi:hypothetical protein